MLLSTQNLRMKGIPSKLRSRFVDPFKIIQCIGNQAYKLQIPDSWRIHNVLHVSLLKRWIERFYRTPEDLPKPNLDTDFDRSEEYEVGRILRKRRVLKRNGRYSHNEYLVLWQGYPLEEATWEPEAHCEDKSMLKHNLEEDKPAEVEPRRI